MKYRLARQSIDHNLNRIILREIRKQRIPIIRMGKKNLRELAIVCKAIETTGLPDHLVCKKLPKKLGSGIFLHPKAKPILKGEVIGPYSGIVSILPQNAPGDSCYAFAPIVDILLSRKEQELFDKDNVYRSNRLYAIDVDAEKEGNFIRFVNHSEKPNVVSHLFKIPKNDEGLEVSPLEVVYVAKKTIHPGEQLLISYEGDGNTYWNQLGIKPFPITPRTFFLLPTLKLTKN
jgi:hypothetical protein